MSLDAARPAPFGIATLAGLPLETVPASLARPVLGHALAAMRRRYAGVFARLADLGETLFLIDPTDLPVAFLLRPAGSQPMLALHKGVSEQAGAAATIRAPLPTLIALMEGRLDGDAAFFGRDLVIEGDMAAVLTLRNALEEGDIRVGETLIEAAGPLAPLLRRAALPFAGFHRALDRRVTALQAALLQPVAARLCILQAEIVAMRALQASARPRRRQEIES